MSTEEVMKFIRSAAEQDPEIRRVTLFGSRARGDAAERSDFDFAVDAPGMTDEEWARWAIDVRDKVPGAQERSGAEIVEEIEKYCQEMRIARYQL